MRLIFYIHAIKGGGAERVCATLANGFARLGHEVYISCDPSSPFAYSIDDNVKIINHMEGCKGHKIWSRFVLCRFFRMLYNIRKTAKALKPDFAIGVMIDYTIFTIIALTGLRIPVIGSHHNSVKNIPSL